MCRGITMTQNAMDATPLPVAARIKAAREERRMTTQALANAVGVDVRTVAGWQSSRSRPSYERLVALATVLGKPVSYFLDEAAA